MFQPIMRRTHLFGVPQSTECSFCWILSPSLENSSSFSLKCNVDKIFADMFQPVMRRTHPSWGFHSLLSVAFVGYFPLRWRTVPHSAFWVMQIKFADMLQPVMRRTHLRGGSTVY